MIAMHGSLQTRKLMKQVTNDVDQFLTLYSTGGQGETDGFMSNPNNGSNKEGRSSTNPGQFSVVYSLCPLVVLRELEKTSFSLSTGK